MTVSYDDGHVHLFPIPGGELDIFCARCNVDLDEWIEQQDEHPDQPMLPFDDAPPG